MSSTPSPTQDSTVRELADEARIAARQLAILDTEVKNDALRRMAVSLRDHAAEVFAANEADLADAKASGLAAPKVKRLAVSEKKLEGMAAGLEAVAELPDPVGEIEERTTRPDGLVVSRMRIPLGVIAMIYESRPDATADAIGLCLKSGNAALLRGGSEALRSNLAIESALRAGADAAGIPAGAFRVVPRADRADVDELLALGDRIDLMVPRGGESLIRFVEERATMPVLRHAKGVCHVYVDEHADLEMAARIVHNGKVQNVAVCNATEGVVVHAAVAEAFWKIAGPLLEADGVEVRGDEATRRLLPAAVAASPEDWGREYLDLTLSALVVDSYEAAIDHLARYGSRHTETIVTGDERVAARFQREVDASAVIVNGSTRLNDGGVLGLGAELGISTSKLHAYGPMGLRELTTRKFVVLAEGHLRE